MDLFKRKNNNQQIATSGPLLIANYETALNNIVTAETAKYVADESEKETMQTINSTTARNSVYVTPEDLTPDAQAQILRSSVNAHLQKAQSEQINAFTNQQVTALEIETNKIYKGKKVKASGLDKNLQPFESVWQNSNTGEINQGVIKSNSVTGIIDEIVFHKNALILKPTFKDKLLIPDRKFIVVYVLDPDTLKPAVDLTI